MRNQVHLLNAPQVLHPRNEGRRARELISGSLDEREGPLASRQGLPRARSGH
jgi:hypothetical protein